MIRIYKEDIDCIVINGQSNEESSSNVGSPKAEYLNQPKVIMFHKVNDPGSTDNGRLETLLYGRNQAWRTLALGYNGPELAFGYKYVQETGRRVLIIKYAYSGSAMVDDGSVFANGLWQWDANPANCNGLPHYSNMMNNFVIPGILKAQAAGFNVNLKAMLPGVCESDAVSAVRSAAFQTTLISFIDKFIEDVEPYGVLSPNFTPIIKRLHNNFSPARAYQDVIRTAQENVAAHYNTTYIDTDSYPLLPDLIHWTRDGEGSGEQMYGEAICDKFLAIA
jgi:hypothetical protein